VRERQVRPDVPHPPAGAQRRVLPLVLAAVVEQVGRPLAICR
jgi:hypothetical protein